MFTLVWSSPNLISNFTNCNIEETKGLTNQNYLLLQQKGAFGVPKINYHLK